LTALKFGVASLMSELPGGPQPWSKRAASIMKLADETVGSIRRLSSELRPAMLDNLGLVATIEWAVEDFGSRTGIKYGLDLPEANLAIAPERATAIYRILQELLTNVVRHAAACQVEVSLHEKGPDVILTVRDNGRGMPAELAASGGSLGILGMQERALAFGGEVVFRSVPGKGTTVQVRIPAGMANSTGAP
jgi:signal transduction histidine kinase